LRLYHRQCLEEVGKNSQLFLLKLLFFK